MKSFLILILGLGFLVSASAFSAEDSEHSQHQSHSMSQNGYASGKPKSGLETLSEIPKSGKSREAGFDNRYTMETTSAEDKLADLCAKGSRGLIILDRKTLAKCGGAPKGSPEPHDNKQTDLHSAH